MSNHQSLLRLSHRSPNGRASGERSESRGCLNSMVRLAGGHRGGRWYRRPPFREPFASLPSIGPRG
jgi:hypothetical protein